MDAVKTRDAYISNKTSLSRFVKVLGLSDWVWGARDVYASKSNLSIIDGKTDRTVYPTWYIIITIINIIWKEEKNLYFIWNKNTWHAEQV